MKVTGAYNLYRPYCGGRSRARYDDGYEYGQAGNVVA